MRFVREKAYAKLNLSLDVGEALPDGYHDMEMLMQSCSLYDDLRLVLTRDGAITAHSNLYYLPSDERNICVKAAKLFFAEIGETRFGMRLDMRKTVPVCAGMGGGSSDAAATLRGLNRLTNSKMSGEQLRKLGLKLGADVPFCIEGGTCLARGRGEVLSDISDIPDCHIVICKPKFSISTASLFAKIDDAKLRKTQPSTQAMVSAINSGDLHSMAKLMANVFEDVLPQEYAEIFTVKERLKNAGAIGSLMTGTGSAVFGIFDDGKVAKHAKYELEGDYKDCFIATPIKKLKIDD